MKIPECIENICLADAYIEKNILYAAGFEQNIFFEWDLRDSQLKWAQKFEGFQCLTSYQNLAIIKYEDRLFYFSINSYETMEFDLRQHKINYYYPKENVEKQELVKLICRIKDEIWFFGPPFCHSVVMFSLKERTYYQYEISIAGREKADNPRTVSIENSICIEDQIWRCVPGTSDLLIIDTNSKKAYVKKTGLPISSYTMNYCEGLLYILAWDGKHVATFNPYTYESYVYETGYLGKSSRPFREVIKIGKHIFLLPCFEQEILCYEINGAELSLTRHLKYPKEFRKIHDIEHRTMFLGWKKIDNNLFLLPFAGNGMLCVELNSLDIIYYPIKITEQYYLAEILRANSIMNEKQMCLEDYLKGIKYEDNQDSPLWEKEATKIGKSIWDRLGC